MATLLECEARTAQNIQQLRLDSSLRERGLWKEAKTAAIAKASQRFNKAAVEKYFEAVTAKLTAPEYVEHVKGTFFINTDTNKDGKVSFEEALGLINSTLQCAADLGGAAKPLPEAIREVFDAHDTITEGWNFMGGDEFLNLMRYLQVQVAEAMLPLSQLIKEAE
jgi:hypothetical protein